MGGGPSKEEYNNCCNQNQDLRHDNQELRRQIQREKQERAESRRKHDERVGRTFVERYGR